VAAGGRRRLEVKRSKHRGNVKAQATTLAAEPHGLQLARVRVDPVALASIRASVAASTSLAAGFSVSMRNSSATRLAIASTSSG
jgi:hypothetical protein